MKKGTECRCLLGREFAWRCDFLHDVISYCNYLLKKLVLFVDLWLRGGGSIARRLHGSRCRCNIAGSRESAIVPLPTATERYG